jgi:hypothetical protein
MADPDARPAGGGGRLTATLRRVLGTNRVRDAASFGLHLAESALLMAGALALALWLAPEDALGLGGQFPWLLLMPALLALRYGTVAGLFAGTLVVAAWFLRAALGADGPAAFPQQYFLGGLVMVLGCGQFSDVWHDRLRRVREVNHYLTERLGALTRSHFLLQLSHQRIEHELLVRPVTLRDLLGELRAITGRESDALAGGAFVLQLLSQSCELESASLHAMDGRLPRQEPSARLGEAGALVLDDPLVCAALEQDRLAHVQSDQAAASASRYLVCAPVESSNRESLGLLAVERLPFFALNQENLQLLAVLLGYWADGLVARRLMRPVLALRGDCPPEFALEVVRLHALRRQADIESALVAFVFEADTATANLAGQIRRMPRSLDLVWEIETPKRRVMIHLLALAGPAAIEGFLARIEGMLQSQFDTGLAHAHIGVQVAQFTEAEPEWTLDDLLTRCRVSAPAPARAQASSLQPTTAR